MTEKLTIFIYRGLPGSGKTTEAKKTGLPVFEADEFFMVSGEYKFSPRNIGDAHDWCQAQVKRSLFQGQSCCVSNTSTRRWEVAQYQQIADMFGADLVVYVCTGEFENTHGVPEEGIERMKARWESWEGEDLIFPK